MNNKTAKKLRKEAKLLAEANNVPWLNYEADYFKRYFRNMMGETKELTVFTGYLVNCGRKLYQDLKKEYYQHESA